MTLVRPSKKYTITKRTSFEQKTFFPENFFPKNILGFQSSYDLYFVHMFSLYFSLKWIISIVASCWGGYHLPKMFEKIMFYCLKEGQKGSNWAQYIVPWPNTKHPLQNLLETINIAWNTVWRVPNIVILLWLNHMKPSKTLKMDILTEIPTRKSKTKNPIVSKTRVESLWLLWLYFFVWKSFGMNLS